MDERQTATIKRVATSLTAHATDLQAIVDDIGEDEEQGEVSQALVEIIADLTEIATDDLPALTDDAAPDEDAAD